MLTMTRRAADAIRTFVAWDAEWDGLRVARDPGGQVMLSVARGPVDGDEALERSGARLYVQRCLLPELGRMSLDADVDGDGVFRFRLQDGPACPA